MDYGKLKSIETGGSSRLDSLQNHVTSNPTKSGSSKLKFLLIFSAAMLIVAAAVSSVLLIGFKTRATNARVRKPSQAISQTCSRTRYPSLCVNSLLNFPGAAAASDKDLVHISVNVTLGRFGKALYTATDISNLQMAPRVRSAYDDCIELLDDSVDLLSRSLNSVEGGSSDDVMTWLSAAMTNHDTCMEGFEEADNGYIKDQMSEKLKDLSELVSNSLAIYASSIGGDDFSGIPIKNRRRLLNDVPEKLEEFPAWLSLRERVLLDLPAPTIHADIVVSKDGSGNYKTITEAIKAVPEYSNRRTIIYVKAGTYEEANLKVGKKVTNVMFIGDGKGRTVITCGKSVSGGDLTTFHTACFAATGSGFMARDMSFQNKAGPSGHQAVALRIGADHGVVYRCNIIGYQDTLYVHSNRQFYRECDIFGTVDFIFGNAAVVFQSCNIYARKPMAQQRNTITAQDRKDPNQNTGISIHACRILATPDLEASKGSFPTYLGRPWKMYSRTVYMLSHMGDHIHPRGWLEWNGQFALNTLYYGEYMNNGPGAGVGQRVRWPGYRVITSATEASKFTVGQFIYGSSWLPSTGVAFLAGL